MPKVHKVSQNHFIKTKRGENVGGYGLVSRRFRRLKRQKSAVPPRPYSSPPPGRFTASVSNGGCLPPPSPVHITVSILAACPDTACRALADAQAVGHRETAAALQAYARQRNDVDMEVWLSEIKLRAERGIGEISAGP